MWKGTEKIINSKCNNFIISTTIEIFEEKFCCQNWSLILLNSFLKFYFLMTFKEIIFWEPPVWFGPLIFFKIYIDKIAFYASKIYPYAWREAGCINYICYFQICRRYSIRFSYILIIDRHFFLIFFPDLSFWAMWIFKYSHNLKFKSIRFLQWK